MVVTLSCIEVTDFYIILLINYLIPCFQKQQFVRQMGRHEAEQNVRIYKGC